MYQSESTFSDIDTAKPNAIHVLCVEYYFTYLIISDIRMGGRGRGRGTGLSFNAEALGFGRGDALPTAMMAPPPMFPPLTNQPVKLVEDKEQEYILAVGKELRNSFRASQFYLGGKGDPLPKLDLRWERFPAELKPGGLKKKKSMKIVKPNLVKKNKVDIEKKLDELGQMEAKKGDDSEDEKEVEKADSEEEEEKKSDAGSGEDEPDEEMDGGTDYASNYFDNGEGFGDDEEDALDEGGIY